MSELAIIDMKELSVTPFFKIEEVLNEMKSEHVGHPVLEPKELVEVRIAGDKNYSPVFPANAMWKRQGNRVITYAERWADAYRNFTEGNPQEAIGTPLEMLAQYGITPEALSFCRALKIYSIESLSTLEGSKLKALGMRANVLKEAAEKFLGDRRGSVGLLAENSELQDQLAAMRAEIEALKAAGAQAVPVEETPAEVIDAYAGMTDAELKDAIADKVGERPKGNPSRATLAQIATELEV